MTDKPDTDQPKTDKPKRPRGPIDFTRLTDRQAIMVQRVVQAGASIGVAQKDAHRASLKAVRDSFDPMIEAIDDEDRAGEIFAMLAVAATAANARRIAQHPLCPPHVAAEIAARLEAAQRAGDVRKKPVSSPKPGASGGQPQ